MDSALSERAQCPLPKVTCLAWVAVRRMWSDIRSCSATMTSGEQQPYQQTAEIRLYRVPQQAPDVRTILHGCSYVHNTYDIPVKTRWLYIRSYIRPRDSRIDVYTPNGWAYRRRWIRPSNAGLGVYMSIRPPVGRINGGGLAYRRFCRRYAHPGWAYQRVGVSTQHVPAIFRKSYCPFSASDSAMSLRAVDVLNLD